MIFQFRDIHIIRYLNVVFIIKNPEIIKIKENS